METTSIFLRSSTKLLSKLKAKKAENIDVMQGISPLSWDGKERENICVVKVEDTDRLYRPLFKQFDDLPKVTFNETGSPFDVGVVLIKQSDNQSTKKKPVGGALRGGYCESCDHWYKCTLKEHLNSNKHKDFVSKLDNFKTLQLVSDNLSRFESFLSHHLLQKRKLQKNRDEDNDFRDFFNDKNNNSTNMGSNEKIQNEILVSSNSKIDIEINSAQVSKGVKDSLAAVTGNPTKYFMHKYASKELCIPDQTEKERMNSKEKSDNEIESVPNNSSKSPLLYAVTQASNKVAAGSVSSTLTNSGGTKTINSTIKGSNDFEQLKTNSQHSSDRINSIDKTKSKYGDKVIISEANFSSSSCSFGDNGVKNALTILQNNMSENRLGKASTDIFAENYNGNDENERNNPCNVISNSEISFQSKSSCNNSSSLHEPTLEKFLKEKDDNLDTRNMPALFPVEDLSVTDIENGIMPVIDKHSPISVVENVTENIILNGNYSEMRTFSDSSKNIQNLTDACESTEPYYNVSKKQSSEIVGAVSEEEKGVETKQAIKVNECCSPKGVDIEMKCHTPTHNLGHNLSKSILERVMQSGSTITSVKNWLLPNGESGSVLSDFSFSKMDNTLVANADHTNCDTDVRGVNHEQTEYVDQQQNLVANWIQSQKFDNNYECQLPDLDTTEGKELINTESYNQDIKSEGSLGNMNMQTPVSEKYSYLTDLSSIPTDSVVSESASVFSQADDLYPVENATCKDNKCKESMNYAGENYTNVDRQASGGPVCKQIHAGISGDNFNHSSVEMQTAVPAKQGINNFTGCKPEEKTFLQRMLNVNVLDHSQRDITSREIIPDNNQIGTIKSAVHINHVGGAEDKIINDVEMKSIHSEERDRPNSKQDLSRESHVQHPPNAKPITQKTASTKGKSKSKPVSLKCHTPTVDKSSNNHTFQGSVTENETISNSHLIQWQVYSPISQCSDYSKNPNDYNPVIKRGKRNEIQNKQQNCLVPEESPSQQFCYQTTGNLFPQNQVPNYYNTGILPGQNFYSEQRLMYMYHQNASGFQSQLYGFSGLSDVSYCFNSPQQYRPVVSPQASHSSVHSLHDVTQNNYNGVNTNSVQNVHVTQNSYSGVNTNNVQSISQNSYSDINPNSVSQNTYSVAHIGNVQVMNQNSNVAFASSVHDVPQNSNNGVHASSIHDVNQCGYNGVQTSNMHSGKENTYGSESHTIGVHAEQLNGYSGVHTNVVGTVCQNSYNNVQASNVLAMNVTSSDQHYAQNAGDPYPVDYLSNSCLSPDMNQYGHRTASPRFYPTQNSVFSTQIGEQLPSTHLNQPFSTAHFNQRFHTVGSSQLSSDYLTNSNNVFQFSEGYASQEPAQNNQTQHWYLSSPGFGPVLQSNSELSEPRRFETISLNDIAEDTCNSSDISFPLKKCKFKENKQSKSVTCNASIKRKECASKSKTETLRSAVTKGKDIHRSGQYQSTTVIEKNVEKDNLQKVGKTSSADPLMTAYIHNNNSSEKVFTSTTSTRNDVPPSVQPLKPSAVFASTSGCDPHSVHLLSSSEQISNNHTNNVYHSQKQNDTGSYISAKVGDTKLKLSKQASLTVEKKTDLMDFWNVRKTGDCRLVFRVNKRKAEFETNVHESGNTHETPNTENYNWEQGYIHPKKRRCLIY